MTCECLECKYYRCHRSMMGYVDSDDESPHCVCRAPSKPLNVLVVGGAGFIGRWVCLELARFGHSVTALDSITIESHDESTHHGRRLPAVLDVPGVQGLYGDAGDKSQVASVLSRQEFDAIVHLAAIVSVSDSSARPATYIARNSLATANFCEALAESKHRPKRLVMASSMCVYGEGQPSFGVVESQPLRPKSAYGLSKLDQELLFHYTGRRLGIPTHSLRLFNVYGPGQAVSAKTGVLTAWADAMLAGERPYCTEDGRQTRDFVYVKDVATAFRLAVQDDSRTSESFNIGTGRAVKMATVGQMMADILGRPDMAPTINLAVRDGDVRHCHADVSRVESRLRWRATRSLEQGLAEWLAELQESRQREASHAETARSG